MLVINAEFNYPEVPYLLGALDQYIGGSFQHVLLGLFWTEYSPMLCAATVTKPASPSYVEILVHVCCQQVNSHLHRCCRFKKYTAFSSPLLKAILLPPPSLALRLLSSRRREEISSDTPVHISPISVVVAIGQVGPLTAGMGHEAHYPPALPLQGNEYSYRHYGGQISRYSLSKVVSRPLSSLRDGTSALCMKPIMLPQLHLPQLPGATVERIEVVIATEYTLLQSTRTHSYRRQTTLTEHSELSLAFLIPYQCRALAKHPYVVLYPST
ncbi:hypothetical protein IW262DRAFT_1299944 [Armillaria fumosa]|nr:hypothetical protein IW262DRAFT_1299944 [Armillaria fumosa]